MGARPKAIAAAITAFVACAAYLVVAWVIVFEARIGPVTATLDESAGRGVHAGDLLALPMIGLSALMFVLGTAACERAVGRRSPTPWRLVTPA
jgi:hypothetical protein